MSSGRSSEYVYELFSDADFVARCAESARTALRNGNYERAMEELAQAEQSAGLVEMRFRDAVRALTERS
jgi:hypothetical protein